MKDTIERFRLMVNALEANPEVFVLLYDQNPGIPTEEASDIYSEYEMSPEKNLLSLVECANGITLSWIHVKNPAFNAKKYEKAKREYLATRKGPEFDFVSVSDGLVSIGELSYLLDTMFSSELFDEPKPEKGRLLNGKRLFPEDVKKAIRNFDEYSDTQEHVTISLQTDEPSFLFLPTDQHQDFESSRKVTVESYLEFLIWSKGLKSARYDFFIHQKPEGPQVIETLDRSAFEALPPVDIDNLY